MIMERFDEVNMETVRPTNTMIKDVFGGIASETWGFRDCAIAKLKDGSICAVIFRRFTTGPFKGETYYGFIRHLLPRNSRTYTNALDKACEGLMLCPDIFINPVSWDAVTEGNRYVYP